MTSEKHGISPRGFSSDTDWLWSLVPAKELVTLKYRKALREDNRNPGSVPVFGTNGRCGWHDTSLNKGPGVILGRKGQGPLGVKWCDTAFWVIDTAYFATANHPDLDLKYFYYLVNYVGLNHLKVGTFNPSLSWDTLDLQLLPFPSPEIQKEITRALETSDRKIENLRIQNDTLEAIAQTLFKQWSINFEFPNADGPTNQPPIQHHRPRRRSPPQPIRLQSQTGQPQDADGNTIGKQTRYGFAKYIRDALPNATFLGFTGTPIEQTDKNTPEIFGHYIDIYDISQAVKDGSTVPIYYESRTTPLKQIERLSHNGLKILPTT